MEYGTIELQQHNQAIAKAGDIVVLSEYARSSLRSTVGVIATHATLTRTQEDGAWWGDIVGSEWCIGSGFDWKIGF